MKIIWTSCVAGILLSSFSTTGIGAEPPRLGDFDQRFTQDRFSDSGLKFAEVRAAGLTMFATQFNHADGYGDGPTNPADPTSPGGRPTLGNNGTFLRLNGLDGQSCADCHAMVSSSTVPVRFGIGGFGGLNDAPIFQPKVIDVSDISASGFAFTDGRLIVPPHLFGSGGVQLLGQEITTDLQAIGDLARANPGQDYALVSKGIDYGIARADTEGNLDPALIEGVDPDLVIKPFGRKGEFATVGDFDFGAMEFHFGMQPVETVGVDVDADGDGVANEVLAGEMSALEIFITTMDKPRQLRADMSSVAGFFLFQQSGCADCHRPALLTTTNKLDYFKSDSSEPYYSVDLTKGLMRFEGNSDGVMVPMFSDLKRHNMGPGLAESFQGANDQQNAEFITAKLWGVGDSAPYLHDGRALSLDEAIRWHGGEAQYARDNYMALETDAQEAIVTFLKTLRLPKRPNKDVIPN